MLYEIGESQGLASDVFKVRLWVPRGLVIHCISWEHSVSGHMGIARTLHLLRRSFVFPAMFSMTKRLVISCVRCQCAKRGQKIDVCSVKMLIYLVK